MSFKVSFIGAGSLVFARTLFTDILSVPEFHDIEVSFTDINQDNLEKTRALCQRDLDANNIPITIQATTDRREAFKGARYIVNCVRIGGLEAFEKDIEIPLKYGVDQCVGDTLCIGGIMYGQRVIAEHSETETVASPAKEDSVRQFVNNMIDSMVNELIAEGRNSRDDRLELIRFMDERGVFLVKGSMEYVAGKLGLSKVTLYGYLDEIHGKR